MLKLSIPEVAGFSRTYEYPAKRSSLGTSWAYALAPSKTKANRHTTTFQFIVPPNECFDRASARQNARLHVRGALQAGKRRYASFNLCCLKRCAGNGESCSNLARKMFPYTNIYLLVRELF